MAKIRLKLGILLLSVAITALFAIIVANLAYLRTSYEYYVSSGIYDGLDGNGSNFKLNNKRIQIFGGSLQYFRIHPNYWRINLRKLKAAGLNTVTTFVPWNLHEPQIGHYDFGKGGSDFEQFLNIEKFLKIAQEEDLFVILKVGPYIDEEWEFGGLPSWLLRYPNMKIRSYDKAFLQIVEKYLSKLFEVVKPLQWTKGGPIIAFQVENDYKSSKDLNADYIKKLISVLRSHGATELIFTSNSLRNGFDHNIPGVLSTMKFVNGSVDDFSVLKTHQPNFASMASEFWTGKFIQWSRGIGLESVSLFFEKMLQMIDKDISFNLCEFLGGTNWGFMNGANIADDDFSPYPANHDNAALLNEAGDYTEKYFKTKSLLKNYTRVRTVIPPLPEINKKREFRPINIKGFLNIDDLIKQQPIKIKSKNLLPMELLPINNNSGQSYGYIIYRTTNIDIPYNSILTIDGQIRDYLMVLINGELKSKPIKHLRDFNDFGFWKTDTSQLNLNNKKYTQATIDLIVENWGRRARTTDVFKGIINGKVFINNQVLTNWEIIPLEFKKSWIEGLNNWRVPKFDSGPGLYYAEMETNHLQDTFLDMEEWSKGICIINGFVLSRYFYLGSQRTSYLPAPFLRRRTNTIMIFEHFRPSKTVKFANKHILRNFY